MTPNWCSCRVLIGKGRRIAGGFGGQHLSPFCVQAAKKPCVNRASRHGWFFATLIARIFPQATLANQEGREYQRRAVQKGGFLYWC